MMSPEDELCLLLARGQLSPQVRERALALLSTPLRWNLLLDRARDHQVFPLLYRNLRRLEFQGVPDAARADLRQAFQLNAAWNMYLGQELARVLRVLNDGGAPVIPLKGVTLSESLYGDLAFRVCVDIDLLVPPGEALRARRLILAHGYTSSLTEAFFVNRQIPLGDECSLIHQKDPCLLELHWTLLRLLSKDEEALRELWSEARPKNYYGVPAYALTPEWELIYLACHAAFHKWHTLKWLADIHDLCVSMPIDWQQVREKAERFELDLVVGATLTACSTLFGPLPHPNLPSRALPPQVQLFPNSRSPSEVWKASLFRTWSWKRPSEKLRYWVAVILVPKRADARLFHLPSSLSVLYYFLRPIRLTCKWSWLLLGVGVRRLRHWLRFSPP
jgi:hypothetical protein